MSNVIDFDLSAAPLATKNIASATGETYPIRTATIPLSSGSIAHLVERFDKVQFAAGEKTLLLLGWNGTKLEVYDLLQGEHPVRVP